MPLTENQKKKIFDLGFTKSQIVKGHFHFGKQMPGYLLVITDTLDWYISLPYPVVNREDIQTLRSYEIYMLAVVGELEKYGSKDTREKSAR